MESWNEWERGWYFEEGDLELKTERREVVLLATTRLAASVAAYCQANDEVKIS